MLVWIKISLKFFFQKVHLTILQHWLRLCLGANQATSPYLNQCWLIYWHIYASLGPNVISMVCKDWSALWSLAECVDTFPLLTPILSHSTLYSYDAHLIWDTRCTFPVICLYVNDAKYANVSPVYIVFLCIRFSIMGYFFFTKSFDLQHKTERMSNNYITFVKFQYEWNIDRNVIDRQ